MKRRHADALKTIYLGPVFHSIQRLGSRTWLRLKGVPEAVPKNSKKMVVRTRDRDGVWRNLVCVQSRLDLTR